MLALILEVVSRTRRKHRISYIFRGFVSKHFDSFLSATRVSSTRVCKKMTCVIDIYPIHKSYAQHLYALVISFGKYSNIPPPLSLSLIGWIENPFILVARKLRWKKPWNREFFANGRNCPTRKTEFRVMRHRIRLLAILRQITRLLRNVYFSTSAARLPIKRLW